MEDPGALSAKVEFSSDRRRAVAGTVELEVAGGRAGSQVSPGLGVEVRPSSRVQFQLLPRLSWQTDRRQYVTTVRDDGYPDTYGARYFFGDLTRKTFSVETRLNLTFSRNLSLQMYAQPLVSTADYIRYKQLARPGGFEFIQFAPGTAEPSGSGFRCVGGTICGANGRQYVDVTGDGNPEFSFAEQDFRLRSLRGNAVLRWEYRPGSTLFLVWQQRRSFRDSDVSGFNPVGQIGSLFSDPVENVFSVKLSYWLGG